MKFESDAAVENKEALKETVKVINTICAGQRAKGPAQQQVKLVTANGSAEVQYDGQCLWIRLRHYLSFRPRLCLRPSATPWKIHRELR